MSSILSDSLAWVKDLPSADFVYSFVCAAGALDITHPAGPTLFRTYDVGENKTYNCTIWEAVRATSATPAVFKRIHIGPPSSQVEYVSAAFGCNNPVKQVVAEAVRVFGEKKRVACIVSIGTGQTGSINLATPQAIQKGLPNDLVTVLTEIAMDSGITAEEMSYKYRYATGIYHRFNVDRGLKSVSLYDWKQLGNVRAHTANYMKLELVHRGLDEVVEALRQVSSHQTYEVGQLGNG